MGHRVERLKQELREATQEEAAIKASYRQHLIHFARAECLQIAKMMHDKFPVELRDLVYQYLCIEDGPIPVGPYYHFRKYTPLGTPAEGRDGNIDYEDDFAILPDGRVKHDHSRRPPPNIMTPNSHFLSPRYVGPDIAFETQKVYYTSNGFSICNVERGIHRFLQSDGDYSTEGAIHSNPTQVDNIKLGVGSVVANHVRRLQIRIKFEHFEMPANATADELYAYERHFLQSAYTSVDGLRTLCGDGAQRELDIEFVVMTELGDLGQYARECDRRYINFLQSFRNTVYMLMYDRDGATVRVLHHDETISPFPRNLTGIFALTQHQWKMVCSLAQYSSHPFGQWFEGWPACI